jgi:hypothetical protein
VGFFGKFLKSDSAGSTKNSQIISALKILQDGSLADNERVGALSKLKSIFLTSTDKDDLRAISQSILGIVTNDSSMKVREIALTTLETIVDNCLSFYNHATFQAGARLKLGIVSGYAVPALREIAGYTNQDATELRRMAFWTLSKIAPFAADDDCLGFLANSLNDKTDNIRTAVVCTFENLVKYSDDALKRRIARFSLSALCQALEDPTIWVRAARALSGLGVYALGAAPFLYQRLDDQDGDWAASALHNITGQRYGKKEKDKWEQWLKKNVVK